MQEKYFDRPSIVSNGYFYTFEYYPRHPKELYDKTPFLYCVGPVEKRTNLFTGINLHHIDLQSRYRLIEAMQRQYRAATWWPRLLQDRARARGWGPAAHSVAGMLAVSSGCGSSLGGAWAS